MIGTYLGITLWIDMATHLLINRKKHDKVNPYDPIREVTVIIPAHKEEEYIEKTILAVYDEKYPVKNIIVCGDKSSHKTGSVVEEIALNHLNLIYVECPDMSKAKKINYVVKQLGELLGEFVYIRDSKVYGHPDCMEKMITHFDSEKVGAVTSYGYLNAPDNFLSKMYHYGKVWTDELGKFRKIAQEKRKAIFVICGASTMYRKDILIANPIPYESKTEDTYHTWILQMKGIEIKIANDAIVFAKDVDGNRLEGLKKQILQSYRWNSGTMQCIYSETKNIGKNKRLFFSTILPGLLESMLYAVTIMLLPAIFFFFWFFALGFIIADTLFSFAATLILAPKSFLRFIVRYPAIFLFKYINALVFIWSFLVVTVQAIKGERYKWSNEWKPL